MPVREGADFIRGDARAIPGVAGTRGLGTAVDLGKSVDMETRKAAGLQDAHDFAQVAEHEIRARNVLENGVRKNEVKISGGEEREIAAAYVVHVGVGNVPKLSSRLRDHFVGDIHSVDLAEPAAHGAHQASGSAADFERAACRGHDSRRETPDFAVEIANDIDGSGEKLGVILIATSEGDVVIGVFLGTLVPIGPHALAYVFHVVILALWLRR